MSLSIPSTTTTCTTSDNVWPANNNQSVAGQEKEIAKDSISNEKKETNCFSQRYHVVLADTAYQWRKKLPKCLKDESNSIAGYTHTRLIYISASESALPRLVAKIKTAEIRNIKIESVLPHAEEIAYKICKLFHWNIVPKSKILHEFSALQENSTEKLQKYIKIMNGFKCEEYPLTFTFQAFVEGKTLREKVTESIKAPNLSSYQKAYLLGCVLGNFDARSDNTILNDETGELFEIDNEYLGNEGYQSFGILNAFKKLKSEEISDQILNDVLNTELTQLAKIREKYKVRDGNLIAFWSQEPLPTYYACDSQERDKCWSTIMENFKFLKMSILALREKAEPITIEKLEKGINTFYLKKVFDKKDVFSGIPLDVAFKK